MARKPKNSIRKRDWPKIILYQFIFNLPDFGISNIWEMGVRGAFFIRMAFPLKKERQQATFLSNNEF